MYNKGTENGQKEQAGTNVWWQIEIASICFSRQRFCHLVQNVLVGLGWGPRSVRWVALYIVSIAILRCVDIEHHLSVTMVKLEIWCASPLLVLLVLRFELLIKSWCG